MGFNSKASSLDLQAACVLTGRLLCACVERERMEKREMRSLVSLLGRTLILLAQGPNLMASFNLNYFLRGHVSIYSHTGDSASAYEFGEWGTQTFSP